MDKNQDGNSMKGFVNNSWFLVMVILLLFLITPVVSAATIPSGTPDLDFIIENYQPDKTWNGTTLFADYHKTDAPRIVEVNMAGEIVWQYKIPDNLKRFTNPGFDVQLLPNNHIIFILPRSGVYEIDRNGNVVWSYLDPQASHDVDRLPNGNTLINRGNFDTKDSAQVIEVDPQGKIVWSWYAKNSYDKAPYSSISFEGWTHINAVTRLPNGNTWVDLRNFNITAEVNPEGTVVWQYDWSHIGQNPHEPELQPNGNILINLHPKPQQVVEINPKTSEIVWQYRHQGTPDFHPESRDADRLPNGNTLINNGVRLIEVSPTKEIVWQLTVKSLMELPTTTENHGLYLYKSERISYMDPRFSITSPQQGLCSPKETEISIDYSDIDLNRIWYRIYDRTNKRWATENITYVTNNWKDAITFEGKETGQNKVTLDNGEYTLHVWASSNGWGDENLYVPVKVNTIEKTVDFSVSPGCAPAAVLPHTSTAPSLATPLPTSAPLSAGVTVCGVLLIVIASGMRKK
jgi:hypothetical protein